MEKTVPEILRDSRSNKLILPKGESRSPLQRGTPGLLRDRHIVKKVFEFITFVAYCYP